MARIVLNGATGFVGSELLNQLLAHIEVSQVTCLTRRPLAFESPKLKVILHHDFAIYDEMLANELATHDGCIWALGGKATDAPGSDDYLRATCTFPISFVSAISARLSGPFSFCYLSGMGADPSEKSWFPWEKTTRHLKGRTERNLQELQHQNRLLRVASFRPGGILPNHSNPILSRLLAVISIKVKTLAISMVRTVLSTQESCYTVVTNSEARRFLR